VRAIGAVYLLLPQVPMLFMGEEWGAAQPFPFFCDFSGDLAEAVRAGRRAEFAAQFAAHGDAALPDPLAEETFRSAVLGWEARDQPPHAGRLAHVRALLALRRVVIAPRLAHFVRGSAAAQAEGSILNARWHFAAESLVLCANLASTPAAAPPAPPADARALWGGMPGAEHAPWAVHWWLE
jgi:1,4-alpha-glucan branching enzyme